LKPPSYFYFLSIEKLIEIKVKGIYVLYTTRSEAKIIKNYSRLTDNGDGVEDQSDRSSRSLMHGV
jgi:hypothetical protein